MSTTKETMDTQRQGGLDNAIDLRSIVDAIWAWRWEILLIGVVTAIVAVAAAMIYSNVTPPTYGASADVVVAKLASEVRLDERIQTSSDTLENGANNSRRAAYVQLASSSTVAKAAAETLAQLVPEPIDYIDLKDMVTVVATTAQDGRTPSDLIRIEVVASDPDLAAVIANVWAKEYIDTVNEVFGQLPFGVIESLDQELSDAQAAYGTSQQLLDTYLAQSTVSLLEAQINEKKALFDELQNSRINIYQAVTQGERQARLGTYLELANAQSDAYYQVIREQTQAQLDELDRLYLSRAVANQQLDAARNLLQHISNGDEGSAGTNQLALQALTYDVFSPTTNLSGTVKSGIRSEITINTELPAPATIEQQQADAQSLVDTLESYINQLDESIAAASGALLSGGNYAYLAAVADTNAVTTTTTTDVAATGDATSPMSLQDAILQSYQSLYDTSITGQMVQENALASEQDPLSVRLTDLNQTIQQLRAELSAERAQEQTLTQQRDLDWNTYDTLSNRLAELRIERSAANSEVRIASEAVANSKPIRLFSVARIAVIAGLFGIVIGLVVALSADFLGYSPFLSSFRRREATT